MRRPVVLALFQTTQMAVWSPYVETGNDLYKTVVRLQLILFSKDIGAF
jgi:hypothetical protein